ncbi:hypothetical protein HOLleu_05489 [Holothuria leucospilota]|uniref:Uncharacterized protein n=1 Tax=Holothuria leucospilota TaxID=206669 RepID=A0A9Q1CL33_HOLLE|nr:hypothetical protein HOLleu_05489 [Holothuria leucospilota]
MHVVHSSGSTIPRGTSQYFQRELGRLTSTGYQQPNKTYKQNDPRLMEFALALYPFDTTLHSRRCSAYALSVGSAISLIEGDRTESAKQANLAQAMM